MTNHVEVSERAEGAPQERPRLDGFDPEPVGEQHAEDGDAFVVVGAGHRTRDVAGNDGDHRRSHQTGARVFQLFSQ